MVVTEVKRSTQIEFLSAGLVLTGGAARLPGLDLLAEQVTKLPARVGLPGHIFGLVDELYDPAFATSVGLLQWAVGDQELTPAGSNMAGPSILDGLLRRLSNWFRVLLPE